VESAILIQAINDFSECPELPEGYRYWNTVSYQELLSWINDGTFVQAYRLKGHKQWYAVRNR
jgi:hypothetical protein